MSEKLVRVPADKLRELFKQKFIANGMKEEFADRTADVLLWADERGIHSHGSVRMQYYSERQAKGGFNNDPEFKWEKTGPSTAIFHGDNAKGTYVAHEAMEKAIEMAEENGVAVVGMSRLSHSGAIGYYVEKAAEKGMVALSVVQSDPMVVPFGGSEPYFGTNPIAFGAPRAEGNKPIVFDMATTVQAWGKILDARSKNKEIPDTWAVDKDGKPTTDPWEVNALLPVAGPKGYGLMMMVDVLAGSLLGLPFGKHVSSMYADLSEYRNLGQLHIVINPDFFSSKEALIEKMEQMVQELHDQKPAPGFDQVYYPGELMNAVKEEYDKDGIPIPEDIVDFLESDRLY